MQTKRESGKKEKAIVSLDQSTSVESDYIIGVIVSKQIYLQVSLGDMVQIIITIFMSIQYFDIYILYITIWQQV